MSIANNTILFFAEENSYGTQATSTYQTLRFIGESLSYKLKKQLSAEISADRQISDIVITDADLDGGFNFELSYSTFDELISAALQSDWATQLAISSIGITFATSGTISVIDVEGPSDEFELVEVGQFIKVVGSSEEANNTYYRVISKTDSSEIVVDPVPAVAKTFGVITAYIDESDRVWTAHGDVPPDVDQKVFGTSSLFFDGDSAYILTPSTSDFDFGTGNFTIDFRFRLISFQSGYRVMQIGSSSSGITLGITETAVNLLLNGDSFTFANSPSLNMWYHIAITRDATNLRAFIDGTQIGSTATAVQDIQITDETWIGRAQDGYFHGWLDEISILDIVRWTENFTPPTEAYYIDNILPDEFTKVLLHFDGVDESTNFTDASGKTWTAYDGAKLDTSEKKFGTASGLFDGAGDYISTPGHTDFNFGTGDFTIDFWFWVTAYNPSIGTFGMVDFNTWSANGLSIGICGPSGYVHTYYLGVYICGTEYQFACAEPATSEWHHLAVCRSGTDLLCFINGVQVGSTLTSSDDIQSTLIQLGFSGPYTDYMDGKLDEFRVSKGIARWTANFTPPTTAYVVDGSLLHCDDVERDSVSITGSYIRNGVTKKSYSIIREHNALMGNSNDSQYFNFIGLVCDIFSLSMDAGSLIKGDISFLGKSASLTQSSIYLDDITDPTDFKIMNTATNVAEFLEDGESTDCLVSSFNMKLANNLRGKKCLTELGNCCIGVGKCDVSGTIEVYFKNAALYNKYVNGESSSIVVRLLDNSGNAYIIDFPKIKFNTSGVNVGGVDQSVMQSLSYTAVVDSVYGYTIQISKFDV